jgi:hypothetical protein
MTPDLTTLLTTLGLGHYAAALISLALCLGYMITWIAPLIPAPSATSGTAYTFIYAAINKIAGNVGHATNTPKDS